MEVFREFQACPEQCGHTSVVTVGTYDGVHIGHQALLKKVCREARESGNRSAVLTFERHPMAVLAPDRMPRLITTLDEKIELFESYGIDAVYVLKFTDKIASMTAEDFISEYLLDCLGMQKFIVGYDHGLGRDRASSTKSLEEIAALRGFTISIVPPEEKDGNIIKSSVIRELISSGNISAASDSLGRDYSFEGEVVRGRGIGKKLGFPTANIRLTNKDKLIPGNGVYTGWAALAPNDELHDAVITVGPSPTFDLSEELIEVHIPGFESDIYGSTMRTGFSGRIRSIEKFSTKQELIDQITKDITHLKRSNHTH